MATDAKTVLVNVAADLERGRARLADLGESAEAEFLPLNTPDAMARYAQMMTPQIRSALANNGRLETILIVLLVTLFATACALAVAAHVKGWPLAANATVIPGLGVTSTWPIRRLTRLRQENLSLELLPVLLPVLPPVDARRVAQKLLGLTDGKQ